MGSCDLHDFQDLTTGQGGRRENSYSLPWMGYRAGVINTL